MVIEINQVPHSEGRGIMPIPVFNPTKEDFEVKWNGQLQGIIPAGKSLSLPEFLAKHAAHHLAELITHRKWRIKVSEDTALSDRPMPASELKRMEEALLKGSAEAFAQMEAPLGGINLTPVEGEAKSEIPEAPVKSIEEVEAEKQAEKLKRKQAAAARAREVMRANREAKKAAEKIT